MFKSPLTPIFLTVFVDVLGLTLVLPLLPFYATHFGASALEVGFLFASYAACQLISGPILGRISDRVGRKPTLVVSQMGTFVAFLTIGFAGSLWMLFLGRIFDGLTAGNLSIAQAYISDVTKPENRTRAFGLIGVAFGMGFLLGPAISGLLASRYGYSAPAFAAAGLSFTSILVTLRLLPNVTPKIDDEAPAPRRAFRFATFFGQPEPRRILMQFSAFTLSFATLIGGLALFLGERFEYDVEKTGYIFAFSGLIGAIIQGGLISRLVKRLGEAKLALAGFITMVIGYGLLGFAYELPMLLVLVAFGSFGISVTRPALTTMLTKSVGRDQQGAALGTSQSVSSLSQIIGPIVAGFLIQHHDLRAFGLASGAFAAVGVIVALTGISGAKPEPA